VKKPSIPAINVPDQRVAAILRPMKENLEIISGARGNRIDALPQDASLAQIISTVNALIVRLNA
jgi:hypothetical protein